MSHPREVVDAHDDGLPPCARCGATIGDSESDVLLVYSKSERDVEITGDLGSLIEAYCETCTRKIKEAHKRHDEQVEGMKRELDSLPTQERDLPCPE
jgi:hypothetical protein